MSITEKSSDAKQLKKSTQSGDFYMILIVFYGGHAKSNEKNNAKRQKKVDAELSNLASVWRPDFLVFRLRETRPEDH